jgi:peptide/nickel transport system ATP-binding protein/oligopeptide transport system ATP-binding protein
MAVGSLNSRVGAIAPQVAPDRPLVEVRGLYKRFPVKGGILQRTVAEVRAVDGVDFDNPRGGTLGRVGASGCGKTTVGRLILRLIEPSAGSIVFDGTDITKINGASLKAFRRRMQIIFQDPYASLDPRAPIGDSIGDGLRIHGIGTAKERRERIQKMMDLVGLTAYQARRYPHEFSGGQRQRIGIARALIVEPDLVVCDEPVSALDVSIQAQVLNLLKELQRELGLTLLFIAHNMAVVENISDSVSVRYLGRVVEQAGRETTYADPRHPYTQALMSAIPLPDPDARRRRIILRGDVPSPINIPTGCRFHPRCWLYEQLGQPENCRTVDPQLEGIAGASDHSAACHYAEESRGALESRSKEPVS